MVRADTEHALDYCATYTTKLTIAGYRVMYYGNVGVKDRTFSYFRFMMETFRFMMETFT